MTESVRVNAVMSRELVERIDAYARGRFEDRSTALRQLVDFALREMATQEALAAYSDGRVTLREFARSLGTGVWAAHDLLAAKGVAVAQGDISETRAAVEDVVRELRAAVAKDA